MRPGSILCMLLASSIDISTLPDNLRNARLEAVSPEPLEEAKLPPVEDIESESEDEDKEDQDITRLGHYYHRNY